MYTSLTRASFDTEDDIDIYHLYQDLLLHVIALLVNR